MATHCACTVAVSGLKWQSFCCCSEYSHPSPPAFFWRLVEAAVLVRHVDGLTTCSHHWRMKVLDRLRHSAFLCLASFLAAIPVGCTIAWVVTTNDGEVCRRVIDDIKSTQTMTDRYSLKGDRYYLESMVCDPIEERSVPYRSVVFPLSETWIVLGSAFSLFALWKDREEHR